MVKEGSRGGNLIRMAVDQETEVAVMPVRIANQSVQHQHVVQRFHVLRAKLFIEFPDRGHSALGHDPPHRQERAVLSREELTGGAELPLPLRQVVANGVDAQELRDLRGVEFGIGLIARAGEAG